MTIHQKYRAVVASDKIDLHGDIITKGALQQMVDFINNPDRSIRMGVDHRRDFPPTGKLENGELLEKDGNYYVLADFRPYEKSEVVQWDSTLLIQYFETPFQFVEVDNDENMENYISIDRQNFKSAEEIESFTKNLKSEQDINLQVDFFARKAHIPDPEVIFKLAILYRLLKPTITKIGDKIGDEISEKTVDESKKVLKLIGKALKEVFFRLIPKSRPVTIIFDLPGKPHIELIARTRNEDLVLKSLNKNKLSQVRTEIEKLSQNVKISKVQFLLSAKGTWKFNYLLTDSGQTIGKKAVFNKRDKRIEMITKKKNGR